MNRQRSLVALGLISLVALAILVGLGIWQLHRLAWKEALIAEVSARANAPPVSAPDEAEWPGLRPEDYEYRHVRVTGSFDPALRALVFRALEKPRGKYGGQGFLAMVPLHLTNGASIIVNRGFVPTDRKAQAEAVPTGESEIVGLMRASEPRNLFTPADNPATGEWYTRDPEGIAAALGVARAAPFTIDADAGADPNALPEGGETVLAFPNNHFEYALTWFGMAIALVGVFAAYAASVLRKAD
jgi:surfeit locus 1 family protein